MDVGIDQYKPTKITYKCSHDYLALYRMFTLCVQYDDSTEFLARVNHVTNRPFLFINNYFRHTGNFFHIVHVLDLMVAATGLSSPRRGILDLQVHTMFWPDYLSTWNIWENQQSEEWFDIESISFLRLF
jgi:hypothetical protein